VSDLANRNASEKLFQTICKKNGLEVDILVNNAGIGDTNDLVDMDLEKIDRIISINSIATSKLCQLFGKEMKKRKRGRIMIMSSIAGSAPGIPTTSIYAASKAFLNSFATSLGKELECFGIGVTCVIPGAVINTNFAASTNMEDSFVWTIPILCLTPHYVASCAVMSMILGHAEITIGWPNILLTKIAPFFIPARFLTLICELAWRPDPFSTFKKDKTNVYSSKS